MVRSTRPRLMLSGKMYRFRFDNNLVDPRYIEAYLQSPVGQLALDQMKTGGSESGLNLTHGRFRQLPVPLAPLKEQHRIVAAIEEHFSHLDAGVAALERARLRIRHMREAVLRAVADCSLVGLAADSFEEWPLGQVAKVQLGRQRSPKNHVGPNMRWYLRAANVTWTGLNFDDIKEMNFEPAEFERFRLVPGDIVLSEASGSPGEVGKPAIWRGEMRDCAIQNTLLRVRSEGPLPEYLLLVFRGAALTGEFARASRGVGIHHLGAKALIEWRVRVPPPDVQQEIVKEAERLLSIIDVLEAELSAARARSGTLRRSILSSAFTGELVGPSDE